MAGAWKDDFPPLLALGFHQMDLAALRRLCVGRFPDSITRPGIMDGLELVVNRLNQAAIRMEVWVDGSFLTEKLNPEDSDIAVQVEGPLYDAAAAAQQNHVRWAGGDPAVFEQHKCDCYPFAVYPPGHALNEYGQWRRAYWLNKFGHNRVEEPKGLAVLRLPFII